MSTPLGVEAYPVSCSARCLLRSAWWRRAAAEAAVAAAPRSPSCLPENETPRYETNDRPDFEEAVEELCEDCEVLYSNAGGTPKTAEPGRSGADPGRRSAGRRPDGLQIGRGDRRKGEGPERAGGQLRPPDRKRRSRRLRLLRQRTSRRTAGRNAGEKTERRRQPSGPIIMINGDPADPNAALFKEGAHNGFEAAGVEHREGIRHARLVRRKRPARGAAGDHRARQQRLRRHLRRQRRHRRRRDRGAERRRDQPRRKARSPVRTRPSPACSGSSPASST